MKKDNSASNEIKLSDQQSWEYKFARVAETENSLRKLHRVLTINQEKIKVFRRERWAELKIIFQNRRRLYSKNQAVYQLYSEDLQLLNTIILQHSNNCPCPVILVKC
jgi:hypothetical protein